MIFGILNFLKLQLDTHLSGGSQAAAEPLVVLSNPWSNNEANKGNFYLNALSLINIEEEKVFKPQQQQIQQIDDFRYSMKPPELYLNLYLLISTYNKNYEDALKFISRVVSYFQVQHIFDKAGSNRAIAEAMPDGVERIVMELYTASFEQQNQIWAALSTGYLPSVIYKVKSVVIDAAVAEQNELYTARKITGISVRPYHPGEKQPNIEKTIEPIKS